MTNSEETESGSRVTCADWVAGQPLKLTLKPGGKKARALGRQRHILEQIVENKVIPRLLIAGLPTTLLTPSVVAIPKADLSSKVGEFAELVVARDAAASVAYFTALRSKGATLEALFQDLLAPVALRLGELWEEDINDFVDVTRGFSHLQQIVHLFGEDFRAEGRQPISNRRALLMPLPGEQHIFGVAIVGQFFRREGWRVWGGPPNSGDEITELVAGQWFDAVGLSASAVSDPRGLAADIRAIRKASLNGDVTILVGGNAFNQAPELVGEVGADETAVDGNQALERVHQRIGQARFVC